MLKVSIVLNIQCNWKNMDLKQYWNYGELTNERQMVDERFGFFGNDNGFFFER